MLIVSADEIQVLYQAQPLLQPPADYPPPGGWEDGEGEGEEDGE